MKLSDVLDVAILHNLDLEVSTNYMDHVPGKLCLHITPDGIHYSLCRENYDCYGIGVWQEADPVMNVIKFVHSTDPRKICKYCTVVA